MTDLLWMPATDGAKGPDGNPNYIRSFDARVQKVLDDWAMLDKTAFYAEGGGQPSDVGLLTWYGGEARVKRVSKKGAVKHVLEGDLPPAGALVHGEVDWDLRYRHMRMHTSQHLLSGVVWKLRAGRTAGNQIHADRSRVDFEPVKLSNDDLRDIEGEVNRIVAADVPLRIYEEDRAVLEERLKSDATGDRSLLNLVPQSVRRLRVVEIADPGRVLDGPDRFPTAVGNPDGALPAYRGTIDFCPCAGTHVARTGELGRMEIVGREAKGAGRERVEYVLK